MNLKIIFYFNTIMSIREKYNSFLSKFNVLFLSKDILNLIDTLDKYESKQLFEICAWTRIRPELSKELIYENLLVGEQYHNPIEICLFIHDEIVRKIVLSSMSFFNHKFNSYSLIGFLYSDYSKQYDEFINMTTFKYNQIKYVDKDSLANSENTYEKLENELVDYICLFLVEFISEYMLISLEEYKSLFDKIFSQTGCSEKTDWGLIIQEINSSIESYMSVYKNLKKTEK